MKVKENFRKKPRLIFGIILAVLFLIALVNIVYAQTSFSFSSTSSNPQYFPSSSYRTYSQSQASIYWPLIAEAEQCKASTDFLVNVVPGSCKPVVVRSDLLEEQNVPVFCQIDIVKLNPLIDVDKIKSVSFSRNSSNPYVVDVSFHPNSEAITSQKGILENPLINNIGYVVVLLKKTVNEKDMPESVKINLTANLQYDSKGFFGPGQDAFYLNVVSDETWSKDDNYKESSIFKGKAYLRLDWVEENKAEVSIYSDKDTKLASFGLQKGESEEFYLPGFYCKAKIKISLNDIIAGVKKVRLEVDDKDEWFVEGERFLDSECKISRIKVDGDKKSVIISCQGQADKELSNIVAKEAGKTSEENKLVDATVEKNVLDEFNNAKKEADNLVEFYSQISSSDVLGEVWAAKALYQLGLLANNMELKKTAAEIFSKLMSEYPDTPYYAAAKEKIDGLGKESFSSKEHYIKLLDIYIPSKDDASADFTVKKGATQIKATAGVEEKKTVKDDKTEIFSLKKLYKSKVDLTCLQGKETNNKLLTLEYGDTEQCGEYTIKLDNIHYKETAKISVESVMPNDVSKADFSVAIGIEKRAIQLTPAKTLDRIENLNKSIEKFTSITNNLGKVVSGMKAACLATSTVLLTENFFSNLGGGASARQDVMPMYYKQCEREVGKDKVAFDNCLSKYEKSIDNDIKLYEAKIKEVNDKLISEQNQNKDKSGFVNRDNVAKALFTNEFKNADMTYDVYSIDKDTGKVNPTPTKGTISEADLQKASEIDLRDLMLYREIQASGSEVAKYEANTNIQKIAQRLSQKGSYEKTPYDKGGSSWLRSVQASYYNSGSQKGAVYVVPIPGTYKGKVDGKEKDVTGFYAVVKEGGYTSAKDLKLFWIQNIGPDGYLDVESDPQTSIDMANKEKASRSFLGVEGAEFDRLENDAIQAIRIANNNYGKSEFNLFGNPIKIDKTAGLDEKRCTDFMSVSDCKLLFNVCDPVLCPSSRCDLGGAYRVDNVIQSGIIGSIALCLPNGDYVPVCLSGIQAGLDSYLSVLKAHRDCLQENLATGKMVGFCDEVYSVYTCEFFWRNMVPFLDQIVVKMFEKTEGQGMKGGGEYLTVKDAWSNLQNSVDFMKNEYGVNAYKAFQARTTGEIGTEFCKMFVSARYPSNKNFFDALLQPDSPVQFMAWFDEIPYSEASIPATSQYKVYYHIYAGKDEGVNFQVYLKSPPESAYVSIQDTIVVDTNYITKGSYASNARDFTAPSGYKELCVRINGKDECGFKKVSTDFGLTYLSDKYYQEQATQDIRTEKECLQGSSSVSSVYSLLQPNVQEGVQTALTPDMKGIVRICSTDNPGTGKEPQRWQDVGYCDNDKTRCWLDMNSVEDAIKNKNILNEAVKEIDISILDKKDLIYEDEAKMVFSKVDASIISIKNEINSGSSYQAEIDSIIKELDNVENKGAYNRIKAEAVYLKFSVYYAAAETLQIKAGAAKPTAAEKTVTKEETTPIRTKWDLDFALTEVNKIIADTAKGGGSKYSQNKKFIDELYADGILTASEYNEINGAGLFNLEENMAYVKLLLQGKAKNMQETETNRVEAIRYRIRLSDYSNGEFVDTNFLRVDEVVKIDNADGYNIVDDKNEVAGFINKETGEIKFNGKESEKTEEMKRLEKFKFTIVNGQGKYELIGTGSTQPSSVAEVGSSAGTTAKQITYLDSELQQNIPVCLDISWGRDRCYLYKQYKWYFEYSAENAEDFTGLSDELTGKNYWDGIKLIADSLVAKYKPSQIYLLVEDNTGKINRNNIVINNDILNIIYTKFIIDTETIINNDKLAENIPVCFGSLSPLCYLYKNGKWYEAIPFRSKDLGDFENEYSSMSSYVGKYEEGISYLLNKYKNRADSQVSVTRKVVNNDFDIVLKTNDALLDKAVLEALNEFILDSSVSCENLKFTFSYPTNVVREYQHSKWQNLPSVTDYDIKLRADDSCENGLRKIYVYYLNNRGNNLKKLVISIINKPDCKFTISLDYSTLESFSDMQNIINAIKNSDKKGSC